MTVDQLNSVICVDITVQCVANAKQQLSSGDVIILFALKLCCREYRSKRRFNKKLRS